MNMNLNNKIIESIFAIIVSSLLGLFGIYYFPEVIVLYPVLFIVVGTRHNLIYSTISLAVSIMIVWIMTNSIYWILLLLAFGLLSIVITNRIQSRKKPMEILITSSLVFLLSILAIDTILATISGSNLASQLKTSFNLGINSYIEMIEHELTDFEIFQVKNQLEYTAKIILNILPSIVIIFSVMISYINYFLSTLILKKLNYRINFIPRFSLYRLPRNIIVGIGIMFVATILLGSLKIINLTIVSSNLLVLIFWAFLFQGLSVLDYKMIQKNTNIIFRFFMLAIIMFLPLINFIITIVGVFDLIYDFRKFRKSV